jgi:HTH-type transcriptional regulator/antitoxin HigA
MSYLHQPGEIVLKDIKAAGYTQAEVATLMGRSAQYVNDIVKGKKRIDPTVAVELAEALETKTAQQWLTLELEFQQAEMKTYSGSLKRKDVMEQFPFALEGVKQGWIKDSKAPTELQANIEAFLAQANPRLTMHNRLGAAETISVSLQAWHILVMEQVEKCRVASSYDPNKTAELLADLKKCMRHEDDVRKVKDILGRYGIRFVLVPHLKKAPVDGVASYNSGNPYIALSLRNAQLDRFWFTLMHECGHIIHKHSEQDHVALDNIDQHGAKGPLEVEADAFARDQLLDEAAYAAFVRSSSLSLAAIEEFAEQQRVHRSIVLGRLKSDAWLTWVDYAREHPSVRDNLSN